MNEIKTIDDALQYLFIVSDSFHKIIASMYMLGNGKYKLIKKKDIQNFQEGIERLEEISKEIKDVVKRIKYLKKKNGK